MLSANQTDTIKRITSKYDANLVGVFGSYARNDTQTNDLDLLVDFDDKFNLFQLNGAQQELTEQLGVKVDLVTTRSLNGQLKSYVEKALIRLI